jgi:transmembrane sensor
MSLTDYSTFSLPDFLADDSFVQWVIHPDQESTAFWHSFLQQYPQQEETVRKATGLIKAYRQQEIFTNDPLQQAVWQRIEASAQNLPPVVVQNRIVTLPVFWKVAAAITLTTIFGSIAWLLSNRHAIQTIATSYGEVKTITLPDHSVVTLNSNSILTYKNGWDDHSPREVWIEGEAFFNVIHLNKDTLHIAPSERFMVHSQEVNIEVLGTSFNVKNRRNKTRIGLISGKIKVQGAASQLEQKEFIMKPGEYVAYQSAKLVEKKSLPNPRQITTWTQHEITFANVFRVSMKALWYSTPICVAWSGTLSWNRDRA